MTYEDLHKSTYHTYHGHPEGKIPSVVILIVNLATMKADETHSRKTYWVLSREKKMGRMVGRNPALPGM